ncbi:MAG: hypothetical protein WCO89_11865 [Syntrophus sp. (in: bacteria)]
MKMIGSVADSLIILPVLPTSVHRSAFKMAAGNCPVEDASFSKGVENGEGNRMIHKK